MSEMNKLNQNPRDALQALTDNRLKTNPNDAFALALKEALPGLTAAKAEQILTLLNAELSGVKGTGADPSLEISKKVAPYIEWFKHPDYEFRLAAARELGEINDLSAVPQFIGALKHGSYDVRQAAAGVLKEIKNPRAVPQLIEALKDGDARVRSAAAEALGKIKDPSAVPQLIEALKDEYSSVWQALESLDVRREAAHALREIKDPSAVPALLEALKGKGSDVGFFRWVADMAHIFVYDGFFAIDFLRSISFSRVDVRWAAARALGEIGDQKAIAPLRARLNGFLGIFGGEKAGAVRAEIKAAIQKLEGK